ncbi:MAG TPA: hypothetical protein VLE73_05855 [Candidatus Saccharimonadales bacterium]|nr:hypothetical protein [Candidatus Saccharimonadales bacterium]
MNHRTSTQGQRGVSRVGFIITIALLIGAGLVVWQWARHDDKKKQEPAANQTVQKAIDTANCDYTDADLCKFFAVRKITTSYVLTASREVDGQKSDVVVKQDGAKKYYMRVTGTGPIELISIDDTTYTKGADGTWVKQTLPKAEADKNTQSVNRPLPDAVKDADPTRVSYKKIHTEACGSSTCYKYQVKDPVAPQTTTYIWFDNTDYQLKRMTSSSANNTFDTSYSYAAVTIAAPTPTRDAAPTTATTTTPDTTGVAGAATTLPKTGDD